MDQPQPQLWQCARDRALQLTPKLRQWPDAIGVAATATIVSHYQRRGDYRVHAAAVTAPGLGSTYSHTLLKGAREREAEDQACALLATRALADAAGVGAAPQLAEYGVLTEPVTERINAVGEKASGRESLPVPVPLAFQAWPQP